jgi:hypothetical protein
MTREAGAFRRAARRERRTYAVFGRTLESEIGFPELPESGAAAAVDCTLRVAPDDAGPRAGGRELGTVPVGRTRMRLSESPDGVTLSFPPFGDWWVRRDGREVVARIGGADRMDAVRAVTLGPVLALALHRTGALCLHGSAVGVAGRAIAILAPKLHGKSTLALALVNAGATLMADDAIAVDPAPEPTIQPGVPSVRLWGDSMAAVGPVGPLGPTASGVKRTLAGLPAPCVGARGLPIASVYVLDPVPAGDGVPPVARARLSPIEAAVALCRNTKLADPLVGLDMAAEQMRRAVDVASRVPVYSLSIVRDFSALPGVVARLFEWHASGAVPGRG